MKDKVNFDLSNNQLCADFALRHRAPLVSAILGLVPMQTAVVEFEAEESEALFLFDGRNIDAWLEAADAVKDNGWKHVQNMVSGVSPLEGPLVVTATCQVTPDGPIGRIILWDGWHRAAAWRRLFLSGKSSSMTAYLILTAK